MKVICISILLALCSLAYCQDNFNLEVLSTVVLDEPGNDIWGYVDGNGIEYAVMGSRTATRIWSLEDPTNPIERIVIPGGASTWRDMKSWEDHLYVTNDGSPLDGLLSIDMSMAPETITFNYMKPDIIVDQDTSVLGQCHNLYIDENGFCYLSGCRITGANKAIIFDLNQDKDFPPIVGIHGGNDTEYSHDLFVQNDIMYSSEINAGVLTLFDVTDKTKIVELGDAATTMNFTHNAWASPDGQFVFTTDERANAYVDSYDVSDPTNIIRLDKFQPLETVNTGTVPHNTHYKDGFLITSWYTDGVVITDVSRPDNMIKVGAFDTYPIPGEGFQGCWGVYPWLPSGNIISSNITNVNGVGELNVFGVNYVRAGFLEGLVTRADNGAVINGVEVTIIAPQMNEGLTNALGEYKTGIADGGTYDVTFSHPDYFPLTLSTTLENGEVTILDAQLGARPEVIATGRVIDSETGDPIPFAKLSLTNSQRTVDITTDANGAFTNTLFVEPYDVVIGVWGYLHAVRNDEQFEENVEKVYELDQGYQDDFVLDLGWEVNGNARTGTWVRETPNPTFRNGEPINVDADIVGDIGTECYLTGNAGGNAASDDVDDGFTRVISPIFNVSEYEEPILQYNAWFYIGGGNVPQNDTMLVNIFDQTNNITVAMYSTPTNGWTDQIEIPLKGLVDTDADLRMTVYIQDLEGSGHLLEGGLDDFRVIDDMTINVASLEQIDGINVYPNPFSEELIINVTEGEYTQISLYNSMGQKVYNSQISNNQLVINQILPSGLYTLIAESKDGKQLSQKVLRQ